MTCRSGCAGQSMCQNKMPPSNLPGGIFVGLSTTNLGNSLGDPSPLPALRMAARISPPRSVPDDLCIKAKAALPDFSPFRKSIHPSREDVAKLHETSQKSAFIATSAARKIGTIRISLPVTQAEYSANRL